MQECRTPRPYDSSHRCRSRCRARNLGARAPESPNPHLGHFELDDLVLVLARFPVRDVNLACTELGDPRVDGAKGLGPTLAMIAKAYPRVAAQLLGKIQVNLAFVGLVPGRDALLVSMDEVLPTKTVLKVTASHL